MRVLVSTSLLSPYRVDWLNELGKYAEIDILYLEEINKERNSEWLSKRPENCNYQLMNGRTFPKIGKISFDVIRRIKSRQYEIIILDGYGYATQLVNMWWLNKCGRDYYVNVDGAVPKENENRVNKWAKSRILAKVPYFLCGSKATAKILGQYGVNRRKIIHHPFTSLFERDLFQTIASPDEKDSLRSEIGIIEEKMIISVGRFSYMNGYGKGYDAILRAAERLRNENIGWYIIGGLPTEEFKIMLNDMELHNVHFVDFKPKEELKKYYRAADLFVLMTVADVWGLVINEAMSCGLPVITTNKCVAGLELVENEVNGYIVDVGDDEKLAYYSRRILADSDAIQAMGCESIKKIKDYTIENMARTHIDVFSRILNE